MIETRRRSGFNLLSHATRAGGQPAQDLLIISHGEPINAEATPRQALNLCLYFNPAVQLIYYSPDQYALLIRTFRVAAGHVGLTPVEVVQPGERARDYLIPPLDIMGVSGPLVSADEMYRRMQRMARLRARQGLAAADLALPLRGTLRLSELLLDLPRPYARVHCLFCRPGIDGRYIGNFMQLGFWRDAWRTH